MPSRPPAATVRPPLDVVTARILTPAWLLFLLGLQVANGTTDALPIWLRNLGAQAGFDPIHLLRGIMAAEIVFAGVMLVVPQIARGVALATLLTLAFSAIASISAAPHDRFGVMLHGLILLVAAALLIALRRAEPRPTLPSPPLKLSPQWRALCLLAIAAFALAVAGRTDIKVRIEPPVRHGTELVEFDLDGWRNMPVSQIPLREYLPALTSLTLEGEHFVVFYSPACGSCHDLFRTHFSGELATSVIAVRIPAPPDATALPSDQPLEIDCPECTFIQLRPGPFYLVQPPVVFRVEDGVIRCIATSGDPGACLSR